jgi:hypothetical protein
MVQGPPTTTADDAQLMAEWGLTAAQLHQEPEACALWPETVGPFLLFEALLSQWRMGPGGPVGLDYGALPVVARQLRLAGRKLREAFSGMRVMEAEALQVFAEQSKAALAGAR